MCITHTVCNDYGELAGNLGQEYIRFCSGMVPRFPSSDTHVGLKVVDGPFHDCPYFVKRIPFAGIPLDAWKHAEVHVFVNIGDTAFFGCAQHISWKGSCPWGR